MLCKPIATSLRMIILLAMLSFFSEVISGAYDQQQDNGFGLEALIGLGTCLQAGEVTVKLKTGDKKIPSLHGVNLGPRCKTGGFNTEKYFAEAKFPLVRLHDAPVFIRGVVDIPCIFPLMHLDENDQKNYKFARTDDYIRSILDTGCKVMYRLGVTIENNPDFRYDTTPPKDPVKWAKICSNIIRHYNHGWANGFEWNIEYWEIWNEPDNGPSQWDGTMEEFTEFYVQVSKILKKEFPELKFGGPSFNGGIRTQTHPKLKSFLPMIKEQGAPLDFLSWHVYAENIADMTKTAEKVREILDANGFEKTESHMTEWNLAPPGNDWARKRNDPSFRKEHLQQVGGGKGAAMVAASLTAFQGVPIDMTNYYHAAYGLFGLFDEGGLPRKQYYVFKAYQGMIEETPIRCAVRGSSTDQDLAVLAGRSEDSSQVRLLVSNFNAAGWNWTIKLEELPGKIKSISCKTLNDDIPLLETEMDGVELKGNRLEVILPRNNVKLFTLTFE